VVVTKHLPGDRWLKILTSADCRVEVSQHEDVILSNQLVKDLIGKQCDGVIGQLTEVRMAGRRLRHQHLELHRSGDAAACRSGLCRQSPSMLPSVKDPCSAPDCLVFAASAAAAAAAGTDDWHPSFSTTALHALVAPYPSLLLRCCTA